jgi:uncharacterized protein with ParB-like and HNH nuclease domain/predicted transport protein
MLAVQAQLLAFLKKSQQFAIPIYQRTYSWTESECQQLWDDIVRAGADPDINAHFVGSVVYIEKGPYQVSEPEPLLVIDGQQRMTTVCLLLEALARHVGENEPVAGFSATKIRAYYLLNEHEEGEQAFKLILTQTDKETLIALLRQKEPPEEYSIRISENFENFENWISKLNDVTALCRGLEKILIVDVALDRERDNPQLIFESMNSTGRELSQADLIRNFILMGLPRVHQTNLYNDHWRPMEVEFGQEAYSSQFDAFVRHYLTFRSGEIPRQDAVYEAFKAYSRRPEIETVGVDALVADLRKYAKYFCSMALGKEKQKLLAIPFQDLRELKVDVAYPFLLELYGYYAEETFTLDDFVEAVRLVESYVFRRAVCAIPTNSLNKTFATATRSLRIENLLESIRAYFLLLPSYRRFPLDDEFQREITVRDLYNFRSRSYWLRRLENFQHKELISLDDYTIEHIMPQKEDLTEEWREALGPEWKRIHESRLHTLGNLTLTRYNSEYGKKSFVDKRDMKGGFKQSPLRLNEGLGQLETWDEATIDERAIRLALLAASVWISPVLSEETLDIYRPKDQKLETAYSVDSYAHLAAGATQRDLWELFRKEVLSLDPCVTEEFLKFYIAYKAETNFVDVVPQASRLRLSLNMPFHDLYDPKGLAKDATNIGRWGNGDVHIGVSSVEDLSYAMGLIRQSFERQMGNGQDDS